jgi:hypothetical protein
MAIGAIIGIGSSLIGGIGAGRARRRARRRQKRLLKQIEKLEGERQEIINPYAGVENMLSNPFANLTVATQAAEMQAQQTDLSLASTLDTLRATGSGAGGATALAQAALSSKQGISASIAQQEAQNERLRAQGQAQLEKQLVAAKVAGEQFVFDATERREMQKLNRLSSLAGAASQQAAAAGSVANQMFGQALGGVAGFALQGGFNNLNLGGGNSAAASTSPRLSNQMVDNLSIGATNTLMADQLNPFANTVATLPNINN